jgi:hypothetical protein
LFLGSGHNLFRKRPKEKDRGYTYRSDYRMNPMSTALRDGIQRLEITSRVTLGVLALGSGVYTYLGARELLNGDSSIVFFAAVIYSVAVTIGIFAFWSFLMRLLPHVLDQVGGVLLLFVMVIGSLMIIAMSAWLNATALAGAAALEQHLANTLQGYSRDLDQAHRYAISAQSLLPDLQMASARFGQLTDGERTGTLTGMSGSGTVVQLLSQMSNELGALSRTVEQSREQVTTLYDQGGKHLAKMRELVSSRGPIGPRSDAFGTEATALLGVIASLQQTSIASAVKRTSDGLAAGFIAPAAGGRTAELAERPRRALTICAALIRRGDLAVCRRFHPELGGGRLDRSHARRAGHHPVRGACWHPPRGHPGGNFDLHDGVRSHHCHSVGARGRSGAGGRPAMGGGHRHAGIRTDGRTDPGAGSERKPARACRRPCRRQ